jgi:hypothetical protein
MFGREPVAIFSAVRAIILCAVLFGLDWTEVQVAGVMLVVETLLALFTRQSVTPNATATEKIAETARTGIAQTLKVFLVAALIGSTVACGASARGQLFRADRTIHASIASVQDSANALCDAAVIPAPDCQAFNKALVPALQAGDDFNRAVRAERVGAYGELLQAIGRLTAAINQYIPEAQRAQLLKLLGIEGVL